MPFTLVVTQLGRQAIVDADNTGTLPVTINQAGLSASIITPVETALTLPAEIKRVAAVGGDVVAPDTLHVSVLDESADVYTAYSLALYLADGTLFAIGGGTDPLFNKAAGSMAAVALDIVLTDIAATSVTFGATNFTEAPATTARQGVVELATVAEAQAGIDALRALTPASAKAAVLGWLLAQDGSGSGLDADMLDGLHATAFALLTGATFSGAIKRDAQLYLELSGGNPLLNFDANDYLHFDRAANILRAIIAGAERLQVNGSGVLINGATAWHAGNDGSGSGLDADTLDGLHASAFLQASGVAGITRAWGKVAGSGALVLGVNITSVALVSTGRYRLTFSTPMAHADYAVGITYSHGAYPSQTQDDTHYHVAEAAADHVDIQFYYGAQSVGPYTPASFSVTITH